MKTKQTTSHSITSVKPAGTAAPRSEKPSRIKAEKRAAKNEQPKWVKSKVNATSSGMQSHSSGTIDGVHIHCGPSFANIAMRAYYIAEKRQQLSLTSDPVSDWCEAERQLGEANTAS